MKDSSIRRTDSDTAFDRLFDQMRRSMLGTDDRFGGSRLRTDRTDEGFVVTADLPGFAAEDLDLRLEDDVLVLRASVEREETSADAVRTVHRRVDERVRVPEGVDPEPIAATFTNGVLQVTLPLAETEDTGRRIEIN